MQRKNALDPTLFRVPGLASLNSLSEVSMKKPLGMFSSAPVASKLSMARQLVNI